MIHYDHLSILCSSCHVQFHAYVANKPVGTTEHPRSDQENIEKFMNMCIQIHRFVCMINTYIQHAIIIHSARSHPPMQDYFIIFSGRSRITQSRGLKLSRGCQYMIWLNVPKKCMKLSEFRNLEPGGHLQNLTM